MDALSRIAAPHPPQPWRVSLWRGLALLLALGAAQTPHAADEALPERLSDTGLYVAGSHSRVQPDLLAFTPQYPLWSDGADKQRWIRLPPGTPIDASVPDAWQFPAGTRLWKEFSHAGRRVETRLIERMRDGSWRYATYIWNERGTDALLAPARGVTALAVAEAPQGRYDVPARADCTGCHEGAAQPVLGFSALQLSPDRDPLAAHARAAQPQGPDLKELSSRGLLANLPDTVLQNPPRIAATSPSERAALGYLHANCGHCHNRSGNGVPLRMSLAQSAADPKASRVQTLTSMLGVEGRYRSPALPATARLITPADPRHSLLALRMRSRQPHLQMPPIGTRITDDEGLALVERWIHQDLSTQ